VPGTGGLVAIKGKVNTSLVVDLSEDLGTASVPRVVEGGVASELGSRTTEGVGDSLAIVSNDACPLSLVVELVTRRLKALHHSKQHTRARGESN